jgi:hypothetical protein
MDDAMTPSDSEVAEQLVSPALLQRWEREHATLGKKVEAIEARRSAIRALIEAAVALAAPVPSAPELHRPKRKTATRKKGRTRARARRVATPKTEPIIEPSPPPLPPLEITPARPVIRGEWQPLVSLITLTADHPVPYPEARDEIRRLRPELGEQMDQTEYKAFYHAVANLAKKGEIIAYKGHLFAPEIFRKFEEDLKAGRVRDIRVPNAAHHSPMGEAILVALRRRKTGAESGHLIWELRKTPEFAANIEKNPSHPYNVLKRFVNRGDIIKRGKRYYYAPLPGN